MCGKRSSGGDVNGGDVDDRGCRISVRPRGDSGRECGRRGEGEKGKENESETVRVRGEEKRWSSMVELTWLAMVALLAVVEKVVALWV